MKFKDFEYKRPNYDETKDQLEAIINKMKKEYDWNRFNSLITEFNRIRNTFSTMESIANVRYTINVQDKFYSEEKEYFDKVGPLLEELNVEFYKAMLGSNFREKIGAVYGVKILEAAEFALMRFAPNVIEDMQLENKLASQYQKLIASAKISFAGKERTLAELTPFMLSSDRNIRKQANEAKYGFFIVIEDELDRIFDELVKVRDRIAKKLRFKNFVKLGYVKMERYDYNEDKIKKFRKQVLDYIVPVNNKLYERQRKRLGLENLNYYDDKFEFLSGNPIPKGDSKWIVDNAFKMYSELSKETKDFFSFMVENDLMDLTSKQGKASGGYCTSFPDYRAPFIFANFNGTAGDVEVLTHEAGHAFQGYSSAWIQMPECQHPTYESCEIHSMSMEFFTWPWMELFFKEDADKYRYYHLGSALKFIPYGVAVDEFQHFVYENPDITPEERKKAWRDIEKKYLPHKNYTENAFLERGGWWFQQLHIFLQPFYYIDYALAEVCALQFWQRNRENHNAAWNDYLRLCRMGGTKTFLKLLDYVNLKSPFESDCVKSVITNVENYLENIDDTKF